MNEISEESLKFLITSRLLDASNSSVEGSYFSNRVLIPDNDNIIAKNPESIIVKENTINLVHEKESYNKKVEKIWNEFKKTEKGKYAFSGPIIIVTEYKINVEGRNEIQLSLGLKSYADFWATYSPEFSANEKNRTYSLGTSSIVKSADDSFIFGVRSKNISSAGGKYEPIGGFLDISKLINKDEDKIIRNSMKDGCYVKKILSNFRFYAAGFRVISDLENNIQDAFLTEKYEELGISSPDIKNVSYLAFTRMDLYQNFNIYMVVESNLESGKILEKNTTKGDGELKAFSVPISKMDEFVKNNKQDITPTLKSILKAYYT